MGFDSFNFDVLFYFIFFFLAIRSHVCHSVESRKGRWFWSPQDSALKFNVEEAAEGFANSKQKQAEALYIFSKTVKMRPRFWPFYKFFVSS